VYSQHEEERYILEAVGDRVGTFLDIGAYDGACFSNTLALVERGWSGVMVEPALDVFKSLLERHGPNERVDLVQAAVGLQTNLVQFWNSLECTSTTDTAHYLRWKDRTDYNPHYSSKYFVHQLTILDLITTFPKLKNLNVLSLDTEGSTNDLLLNFPFDVCRPKVICFEYNPDPKNLLKAIDIKTAALGYKLVYKSEENMVLVNVG